MSKHLILILLIISLAFNLAVAGMFLYTSVYRKAPFCPPGFFLHRDKSDKQFDKRDFRRDSLEMRLNSNEEIKKLRDDFRKARLDFVKVMLKDDFSVKEARAAMDKSLQIQGTLEKKLGESLIDMREKLPPEEAKRLFRERLERIERRHKRFQERTEQFKKEIKTQRR